MLLRTGLRLRGQVLRRTRWSQRPVLRTLCPSRSFFSSPIVREEAEPISKEEAQSIIDGKAQDKADAEADRLTSVVATEDASPKVQAIVDQVLDLSVLETLDLVNILKDKFGYVEQAMMAAPVAGAGPAAAEEEEAAPVEEQTAFTIKLESFDAKSKIKVIKEVRSLTGLGLKQAKELVEAAPTVIKKDCSKDEAEKIMETLKGIGAEAKME